jgi:hypothetical protein
MHRVEDLAQKGSAMSSSYSPAPRKVRNYYEKKASLEKQFGTGWIDGQRSRSARNRATKAGYTAPQKRDRCGNCCYIRAVYNKTHLTTTCKQHNIVVQKLGICSTYREKVVEQEHIQLELDLVDSSGIDPSS